MAHFMVRQHVADYDHWRSVYDSVAGLRKENGQLTEQVFRDADDPNHVVLLFAWDSHDHARRYSQDPRLRDAMQAAGVISKPEFSFLDEV